MKKKILILMMIACLGSTFYGCGYNGTEGSRGTQSNNENNAGASGNSAGEDEQEGSNMSTPENSTGEDSQGEGIHAIDNADFFGRVIDFSETGCTLGKGDLTDDTATTVADGVSTDSADQISVRYREDTEFQIVVTTMTDAKLEAGSREDVKKSSTIYVYGDKQADGTFLATRVLIEHFQG